MKALLIAAAIATTSLSALAEGATYDYPQPAISNISRAEVVNELKLAAASGALVAGERSYVAPETGPALSRAEVRAALDLARRNHELSYGEFSFNADAGSTTGSQVASR